MANTFKIDEILPGIGYLIVEPKEAATEVAGIINPTKDKEVPQWGTIVKQSMLNEEQMKMFKWTDNDTTPYHDGQTVIYKKWGGNDVHIGGKKYYFLRFEEVIGFVK